MPGMRVQGNFKATQILLTALLAGQEPTLDILYRAGLGRGGCHGATDQERGRSRDLLASCNVAANESVDQAA